MPTTMIEADPHLLEEMLLAQEAAEPGGALVGQPIGPDQHMGAPDVPTIYQKVESAGWVTVYHTETGEPSRVNRNMLPLQLSKKLENGRRAFTTDPRKVPAVHRGSTHCFLHPEAPERPEADALGLPTCTKTNLLNGFQAQLHMRHRHKTEFETIQMARQQRREDEERVFRQAVMRQATALHGVPTPEAPEPGSEEVATDRWAKARAARSAKAAEARGG